MPSSNGAAIALVPDLPSAQVTQVTPAAHGAIEALVGEVLADVTVQICGAAFAGGGLTAVSREVIGNHFVRLFELKTTHPEVDFALAGKTALGRRLDAIGCGKDPAVVDKALDEVLSWPLDILRKVIATERARAN